MCAAVAVSVGAVERALLEHGLCLRGGFAAAADAALPPLAAGVPARALLLAGNVGSSLWASFAASPEHADGLPDPLDRWSRRVGEGVAARVGARALYPFGGPPHHPFQRWARRAEALSSSPLGLLIHPDHGLWHAYRFALLFAAVPDGLLPAVPRPAPCATCADQPCLSACPAAAFDQPDPPAACVAHLRRHEGAQCMSAGCLARRACPHGHAGQYVPDHARFHMRAYRDGFGLERQ